MKSHIALPCIRIKFWPNHALGLNHLLPSSGSLYVFTLRFFSDPGKCQQFNCSVVEKNVPFISSDSLHDEYKIWYILVKNHSTVSLFLQSLLSKLVLTICHSNKEVMYLFFLLSR